MTETQHVTRLPASRSGDPDRALVIGSVYNDAQDAINQDLQSYAEKVKFIDEGRFGPPAFRIVTSTDSPQVETSLVTRNLPDLDYRHNGPGGQRIALDASGLTKSVNLRVGTDRDSANRAAENALTRDKVNLVGFGTFSTGRPAGTLDLDLVSPPQAPLFAAIAIPNLLEARKGANESSAIGVVTETGGDGLDIRIKSETTTASASQEVLLVASKVKEVIKGGHLKMILGANTQGARNSAIQIGGVEIGGRFVASMTRNDTNDSTIPVVPNSATIGFTNVMFRESTANVRVVGDWDNSNLLLRDVQVIDSRLKLVNRPDDTPAAGMSIKPLYDRVVVKRVNEAESSISHRIEGTRFADSMLVGAFDVLIDEGAKFRMHVDSKAGEDQIFGIFDFQGETNDRPRKSRGFGFVTFDSGTDADDVTMAVFHGENLAKLMAAVDAGPGADTVGITEGVTLENAEDYEPVLRPNNSDADDDEDLERHIARMRNLFLDSEDLTYQQLELEARSNRHYHYFAKIADVD